MATTSTIILNLRETDATPKNIILWPVSGQTVTQCTTIYMFSGDATPKNIVLRDPCSSPGATAYEIDALNGSYVLTGQDSTLKYGRIFTSDSGSYTISGQDASLEYGRVLSIDGGVYLFTGQDADLIYTPVVGSVSRLLLMGVG